MSEFFRVTARSGGSRLWVHLEVLPTARGPLRFDDDPERFRELEDRMLDGDTSELVGPPLYLPSNYGTRGDLLWTGASPPLVSDRLVAALRGAGCTGFETHEVEVRYRRGTPVPGYQGLRVTGLTGRWEDEQVPRLVEVSPRGAQVVGAEPGLGWDGSDVFVEPGQEGRPSRCASLWVTARAMAALRAARLTGLEVEPAARHRHLLGFAWPEEVEASVKVRMLLGVRRALGELLRQRASADRDAST